MAEAIVTIVTGPAIRLEPALQQKALGLVKGLGMEVGTVDTLAPGEAIDIAVRVGEEGIAPLRKAFANFGTCDVFVQKQDEYRRKRLLIADMDATMIEGETLDELAAHFGMKDKIAPITAKAMRGEIDFAEALRMRVGLLKGLPVSALYDTLKAVKFSKGGKTLVQTMNRFGAKCVLISGGFDLFTSHVATTLGFYKNIGNRLGIADDELTGDVIPPIVDKFTKKRTVEDEARELGLDPRAAVAIGDGANDIPMLQMAGAGVGYFGKPAVVEATPYQIRHTGLTTVLYMQGYRRDEFVQ